MLDIEQFQELVIQPTLEQLDLYTTAAAQLVLGTAIQESRLTYIKQIGGGPALGVCQMEPATHADIWVNYLAFRDELKAKLRYVCPNSGVEEEGELITNLAYAVAMCRIHYLRVPEALPLAGDVTGMANYWKAHYNTVLGAGTAQEYIDNWNDYS